MFGNMMEQMGLPQPIQVLPYEQRYKESFFRILITIIAGVVTRVVNLQFEICAVAWALSYVATVLLMYLFKVPKKFTVGTEFKFFLQYFLAFFIVYIFVDNGILTFSE
ncbi:hypothetical protein M9Y10_044844 [Tritrichomonas musculus]|uniref:Uncharacterized protein n=1 Tax=Tritrichomonas musculus TaxID=1915356 RepID=A0ABR2JTS4_9EUKA